MSAIDLAVFDLDGTIIDSEWAHEEAKRAIIAELGGQTNIDIGYYTGRSNRLFWQAVLDDLGRTADVDELVRRQFAHVTRALSRVGQGESPGLSELLGYLKRRGIAAAVCSGSEAYFVRDILRHLDVEPYFDVVVSGNDALRLKPDPDIYLAALRKAGVPAARALAVEDSLSGCLAVRAAGMCCVGYTANGRNPQDLSGADWRVADMAQVIGIIAALEEREGAR